MKKLNFTILLFCLFSGHFLFAQSSDVVREYIDQYKEAAMQEMLRSGVPAAITLAQGIHESAAGTSKLVRMSNNHFGIKCKGEWTGPSVSHDDDARGECFRKYGDPMESYRDHSDFLATRSHYAFLFKLDPTDYEGWAYGLKKAGYATNPKYPQILIKIIRDYNLDAYTLLALEHKKNGADWASNDASAKNVEPGFAAEKPVQKNYPSGVFAINKTKVVWVEAGESFLKVANEHHLSLHRLFDFNDMQPQDVAAKGQLMYLQRKRKVGAGEFHTVETGETLYDIAQEEGLRLESLLEYNHLKANATPAAGEKLYLATDAPGAPRTVGEKLGDLLAASKNLFKKDEQTIDVHTVQPKETLYSISRLYGMSVEEIKTLNQLSSPDISTGQQLKVYKNKADVQNTSSR